MTCGHCCLRSGSRQHCRPRRSHIYDPAFVVGPVPAVASRGTLGATLTNYRDICQLGSCIVGPLRQSRPNKLSITKHAPAKNIVISVAMMITSPVRLKSKRLRLCFRLRVRGSLYVGSSTMGYKCGCDNADEVYRGHEVVVRLFAIEADGDPPTWKALDYDMGYIKPLRVAIDYAHAWP